MQTNSGGRGQSIAVAVKLRIFQIAGFAKTGLPFQNFRFLIFGSPNFLCLLELNIAPGRIFRLLFFKEKKFPNFEIKF